MKHKSRSNKIKLKIPIIINNENEEETHKLIRPTPINIKEKKESPNKFKNDIFIKSNENKTYISEGSCSYSK